ncbi:DNA-binding transcriptional LysR family regulator [Bacillus sp. SORGH_AS 510]|uniref:LysR family transcriptional regulator n=1 Tax=Bacillus sp. SORGH_AS_0510 TaxID=3041771 RepID=UPI002789E59A|nr:LysR family transcriptional regulator [Bacillus sp. SORGH_AS_0510]MDQ1143933.1 DNA-binding transcriptional LysR family regulator [Bacillus sp. SORGH_AS_0510]
MDNYLEVFVKVVEKGNFSKAAEDLHMTQPAVSQYIKVLEESVGARLLERNNKFVRLNKAGEIVFHHAKEILALYSNMQYLIDDLTNKASGPIAIGASYTFGEYILPHIIARLQAQYPLITPTIQIHNTKEIIDLVQSHQLDIGIVEGHINEKVPNVEVVAEDKMVIVASPQHPLLKEKRNIAEWGEECWILREKGSGTREAAEHLFQELNFTPKKVMEFGSTQVIKESVEAGLGISLLSQWTIKKELMYGYLEVVDVEGLPFKRNFSILTHSPYQTKALQQFIETLRVYLGD